MTVEKGVKDEKCNDVANCNVYSTGRIDRAGSAAED